MSLGGLTWTDGRGLWGGMTRLRRRTLRLLLELGVDVQSGSSFSRDLGAARLAATSSRSSATPRRSSSTPMMFSATCSGPSSSQRDNLSNLPRAASARGSGHDSGQLLGADRREGSGLTSRRLDPLAAGQALALARPSVRPPWRGGRPRRQRPAQRIWFGRRPCSVPRSGSVDPPPAGRPTAHKRSTLVARSCHR